MPWKPNGWINVVGWSIVDVTPQELLKVIPEAGVAIPQAAAVRCVAIGLARVLVGFDVLRKCAIVLTARARL